MVTHLSQRQFFGVNAKRFFLVFVLFLKICKLDLITTLLEDNLLIING